MTENKKPYRVSVEPVKLVFAIGNPTEEYKKTYHNAGMLFVDYLVPKADWKNLALFSFAEAEINGQKLKIAKSNVFMNESGLALKAAIKKFSLKPENILVAQDDSDIALGKFKYSFDSRSAGHKGIDSIITAIKTQRFLRLRIGIRKTKGKALRFVLKKISDGDLSTLEKVFAEALTRFKTRT